MSTYNRITRRQLLKGAALAGVGALLAACKPAGAPTPALVPAATAPAAEPPTPIPPAAVAEKVELVQWDWWVTQGPWFDEEIKLFNEANPKITVKRVMQQDMDNALPLSFREGTMPDFYMGGPSLSDQYAAQEMLALDLSGFPDFEEFKASFPNPKLDFSPGSNLFDGRVYTAPRENRSGWWNQVFANLDILKQYDVQLPDTADQFVEACRTITNKSNKQVYGYANGFATGWMNMLIEWQGARSFIVGGTDNRTNKSTYGSNVGYIKILEMLATLMEEGLILPEASSIDDEGMRAMFADGKVAFINGGMWNVNGWKQTHPSFANYTIIPPVLLGDQQDYCYYTGPGSTGTSFFVGAKSKHPQEAWLWFKWLHTKQSGERWVKSGNGFSIFPEANKEESLTGQVWKDFAKWDRQLNRVGPSASLRNSDCGKLSIKDTEPNFPTITSGVYSGQIKASGLPAVLAKLAADKDAAFQTAFDDAKKAGAQVELEDWIFPDWDPLKDYITEPKS